MSYWKRRRVRRRNTSPPEMTPSENSIVKLFITLLRKQNNQLFINNSDKKILIKYKRTTLIMDNGFISIDMPHKSTSLVVDISIEAYLWKEFLKTYDKKMFIIESKSKDNLTSNINQINEYQDYQF